jgi:hypothetical protein
MTEALSRVDKFLNNQANRPQPRRGNLIFALDATASRKPTWDAACQLQAQMFREVAAIGSLSMQLVYYRGPADFGGECKASRWSDNPREIASLMSKITCEAGHTQIEKVLGHAIAEGARRKIGALVFVGDACEEHLDRLIQKAAHLAMPAFLLQEGHDPIVYDCFSQIARMSHGASLPFDSGNVAQLAELLRAVALFSVGGMKALEKGSEAAKRLLAKIPPPPPPR